MKQQISSCLVLGGGLSGLMAATILQKQGIQVTVVDKGYGIGGRLASRSVATPSGEKGLFDYGAQYFTAHDSRFQTWIEQQVQQGVMKKWADGFPNSSGSVLPSQEQTTPYWRGTVSNRSVAQALAKPLDVRNQTRIEKILACTEAEPKEKWKAIATNGQEFFSDAVIMTSPVPQTLQILDDSGIQLDTKQRQKLEQVSYSRTIAILAVLDQESTIPAPGGVYVDGRYGESDKLMWIASNSQKGISPLPSVTMHATPEFSDRHWDDNKDEVAQTLLKAAAPWLGDATVVAYHFHRWGYSQPTNLYESPFAVLPSLANGETLLLAGDAFGSAPVASHLERAWLSGCAAASHLLNL